MADENFIYSGKKWRVGSTIPYEKNSFFHSTFGLKNNENGQYLDKLAQFRRRYWSTFLMYFEESPMPTLLRDLLRKCMCNDELQKPFDVMESLKNYIYDIEQEEHDVTVEDIPILATLGNRKIIVFTHNSTIPTIIKPNSELLGDYPRQHTSNYEEVILYLDGNNFVRLEPVIDEINSISVKVELENKTEGWPKNESPFYEKLGTAGIKGVEFQLNLLIIFLLNAVEKFRDSPWRFSTENILAGKFDDAILELEKYSILLQAKHKEKSTKIMPKTIFSTNRDDGFSLGKYFFSYHQEIKKTFTVKYIIICTNASVDKKMEEYLSQKSMGSNDILHIQNSDSVLHMFKNDPETLRHLKQKIIKYHDKNKKFIEDGETIISDENIKDFIEHLQFYFNYPSCNILEGIINSLVDSMAFCKNLTSHVTYQDLYPKIKYWFKYPRGEYLTKFHVSAIFCEIRSDKYSQILKGYNVQFKHSLILDHSKKVYLVQVKDCYSYILHLLKVYQTLQNKEILIVNPDDSDDTQDAVIEAFKIPHFTSLIMPWKRIQEQDRIYEKLALMAQDYKKIFVLGNFDVQIAASVDTNIFDIIRQNITFGDLAEASQEEIITKKNVMFQGRNTSVKELVLTEITEDFNRIICQESLEKIIKNEVITVGSRLKALPEDVERYYVPRSFKQGYDSSKETTEGNIEYLSETNIKYFSEEDICRVEDKIILITDSPGMGKSTILTKLGITIKEKYPDLWVIRIDFNEYSDTFKEISSRGEETIDIVQLMNSKDSTKLTTTFENNLFRIRNKIVLLLDGVDEVSPEYTKLVLNLLSKCRSECNIFKMFITTRAHVTKELVHHLHTTPFTLKPFRRGNQIKFLDKFWTYCLNIADGKKEKCKVYAKELINKIHLWTNYVNIPPIMSIPLQLKMIAEIFLQSDSQGTWEGCKEYLDKQEMHPNLPTKMDIIKLYDMFIQKKRNVFQDKNNPDGRLAAEHLLMETFNKSIKYHQALALETILGVSQCKYFSCYHTIPQNSENFLLLIGIVQQLDGKYKFLHKTFGEYFVAQCLLFELQNLNQKVEFQKILIDEIIWRPEYMVVTTFFNNMLEKCVDSLPCDVLQPYQNLIKLEEANSAYLIHTLAAQGHLAILRFILKCIDFRILKGKEIKATDINLTNFDGNDQDKYGNKLHILKLLIEMGGLNIKDNFGNTPLHKAVAFQKFDMVKFLVEQGASINSEDNDGKTVLEYTIMYNRNNVDLVKYLIRVGADVNIKYSDGTLLHLAFNFRNADLALFLLEYNKKHFISPLEYNFLKIAVSQLWVDITKFLVNNGVDVNTVDGNGSSILHNALTPFDFYALPRDMDINDENEEIESQKQDKLNKLTDIVKLLLRYIKNINIKDADGNTPLHLASWHGLVDIVKLLVENGAHVNVRDIRNCSALHNASRNGNLEIVSILLEHGCDVNVKNIDNQTPLLLAALSNNNHVVKLLLNHGSDSKVRDHLNQTPLHYSLLFCNPKYMFIENNGYLTVRGNEFQLNTVKILLNHMININDRDSRGRTALHLAINESFLEMVELLIKHGANVNIKDNNGYTALHSTALCSRQILLQHSGDISVNFAHERRSKIMQMILKCGADVNVKDNFDRTPLFLAALNRRLDCVMLLLEYEADINIRNNVGDAPIFAAIQSGCLDIAKLLIKYKADIDTRNANGHSTLHIAIAYGQIEIVKLLLENRVNLELRDNNGYTALHLAVSKGKLDITKILLQSDADVNAEDNFGNTALHLVTSKDDRDCVKLLLEHGADINVKNKMGESPIYIAIKSDCLDLTKLLLESKTGNDIGHNNELTVALCAAILFDRLVIVKWLVENKVYFDVKNENHFRVLCCAIFWHRLDIIKMFLKYGADVNFKDTDGNTALHSAVVFGYLDIVILLLEYKADVKSKNKDGQTAFHLAAIYGGLDIVKFLIENNTDFSVRDNNGNTALHLVVPFSKSKNHEINGAKKLVDIIKLLVQNNIDINVPYNIFDKLNMGKDFMDNINLLKNKDVINVENNVDKIEVIQFLLECGTNINAKNNTGYTALHVAVAMGSLDITKLLVKNNANVNAIDNNGSTALHEAVAYHKLNIDLLLVENEEVNVGDNVENVNVIKFLLESGTNVQIKNNAGYTALHIAAARGWVDITRLLIENHADINITDNFNRTALDLAVLFCKTETAKFVEECISRSE